MTDDARTAWVMIALVVGFAALVTTHVAVVYGIARSSGVRRAAVAALVPPFAPYAALREGMSLRAAVWMACAVLYVVALSLALAS